MGKLFIDITELTTWQGKLTGVPRVMDELSKRFALDSEVIFVAWDNQYKGLKEVSLPDHHEETIRTKSAPFHRRVLRRLSAKKPSPITSIEPATGDTLFVLADWHGSDTAFIDKLLELKRSGVMLAQISYDLLPIVTPQYSGHATESFTRYARLVYPECAVILAISSNTKKDITKWLTSQKLSVPKIEVMRLGDDFTVGNSKEAAVKRLDKYKLEAEKFILCVGTIETRKNHTLLYNTYKLAKSRNIKLPKLVIVGRLGWQAENIYEMMTKDPDIKDQIIILESASDNELSWLYENCLFTVYPSFYEGWGLPIAESIAYGKPCISSNTSSMPEIAGDLIDYFSPFSPEECLAAITELLKPQKLKQAKEKISHYMPITWDESFRAVKSIIEDTHAKQN